MTARKAIAVRPYGDHIRSRVFAVLRAAGVEVTAPPELSEKVPNDEVVAYLARTRANVLLVPFHAMITRDGVRTNGFELVTLLRTRVRWTVTTPVIMPVSKFGQVALEVAARNAPQPALFPMPEAELEDPLLPERVRRFLQAPNG